jgi:hypothetical protein
MQFDQPIDGEIDLEDDGLVDAAEAMMDMMRQMIDMQQQQIHVLAILSNQLQNFMTAPRRVVRDDTGRVIGATIDAQ